MDAATAQEPSPKLNPDLKISANSEISLHVERTFGSIESLPLL